LPGGYAEIRRIEGRMNTKKNYERSGEMWTGFGVKSQDGKTVTLGGRSEKSQQRINFNTGRDGDVIIAPSEKEIQELRDFLDISVKKYINAALSNQ
jgi:hypothetical protein